jgi:FAD/FMN-containing dehydrogenase
MLTRRELLALFVKGSAGWAALPYGCGRPRPSNADVLVNDVHSRLNATRVTRVATVDSLAALRAAVRAGRSTGTGVSIAGGRHSMGGQQFAAGTVLIDTRPMNRVLHFDRHNGVIEVEAGIDWPQLIDWMIAAQAGDATQWAIIQKQTGADRLTIGGALGANAHGRGLTWKPFAGDVAAFTLMDANGTLRRCSRDENPELFRLAIGGYGLFGVITSVALRLMPRTKLERVVELIDVGDLMPAFERRIAEGYLYGDCQFSVDPGSDGFLERGVFSCYRPVAVDVPLSPTQRKLSEDDWRELLLLAHTDPRRGFERYASYYLSTSGQRYWSDTSQLSTYIDDYHRDVDRRLGAVARATEMITEVYVPRDALPRFMATLRDDFRRFGTTVIYGTIRLIERDDDTFLPWARDRYACIVMNLHVEHTRASLRKAGVDFRRIIDRAIAHGGSYFLTYHRWASRRQVETCYPQFVEVLRLKKQHDPRSVFQSDWHRHYASMFADAI